MNKSIVDQMYEAFEKEGGGCGHDLGIKGLYAIIRKWEEIRSPGAFMEIESELIKIYPELAKFDA